MKALLQRVTYGSCTVDGKITGEIGKGLVIFFCAKDGDTDKDVKYLAEKCVNLRIFEDENGKMNCSLLDIGGDILAISQFTLYADSRKGRRPSFSGSGSPEQAEKFYEDFKAELAKFPTSVQSGIFGADMKIVIHNDGPATFLLESENGVGI